MTGPYEDTTISRLPVVLLGSGRLFLLSMDFLFAVY